MNYPLCPTFLNKMADKFYFICETGAYVKDKKYYINNCLEKNRYAKHNNDVNDVRYQNFISPITNAIVENQQQTQLGFNYGYGRPCNFKTINRQRVSNKII